jgi:Sec-independent protein translocase protein TatA
MKRGKNILGFRDFLVVLILLAIVLVIPLFFNNSITGQGIDIGAKVISPISLSKTSFAPNEQLTGSLKLDFKQGDLIPENSKMYFLFESPKCPKFFFCNDSSNGYILWCNYTNEGECECISNNDINERCGDIVSLNCEDQNLSLPSFCCEQNELMGLGEYYPNLNCEVGDCWGNCQIPTKSVINMIDLIEISTTPTKGNYTQGPYNNVDGGGLITGSGKGFGACRAHYYPSQRTQLFSGQITGYAIQSPTPDCVDHDEFSVQGDAFTYSYCTDSKGSYYDFCSTETEGLLIEYYCPDIGLSPLCQAESIICPYGCEEGKCLEYTSVQPEKPDLVASNIRHIQDFGSIINGGERKLVVTISNPGEGTAGQFVVCAYFKGEKFPPICFVNPFGINIRGLAAGSSIDLELGNPEVEGKTVVVYVDYTNIVDETNERNNIIEKYFIIPQQCIDGDEGSLTVKGRCNDGTQTVEDECLRDGRTLKEWDCDLAGLSGISREICVAEFYDCIALGYDLGCSDGACKKTIVTECIDPDGKNYTQKGTCTDMHGDHTDECIAEIGLSQSSQSQGNLIEYYCNTDAYPALCVAETYDCVEKCEDGRCTQKYSCNGWNDRYETALSSLALYAPPQEGEYNLTIKLVYPTNSSQEIELTKSSALLIVNEETQQTSPSQTYKGCVNQQCILLQGSGNDECSTDSDCSGVDDTYISCLNYFDLTECLNAGCYWYGDSCHTNQKLAGPSLAATPINLEEKLGGISWWVWLIIGIVLLLIIVLFAAKKILPSTGKSSKEEKNEIRKKYPALVSYINRAKNKGMLREQLKAKLEEKGWPSGVIDRAINEFW